MEQGDLIIRPAEIPLADSFRAEQLNEALFIQLPDTAKRGLVCIIDKFGDSPTDDCRGFRIHKIPDGKKVAFVRPTQIPDIVWERAFPFEGRNLTPPEQAQAALAALDLATVTKFLSTYTLECLLEEKGIQRAQCKLALETSIKVQEAFILLENAIDEVYEGTGDAVCLLLKNKLHGWRSEFLGKCKLGLERIL